MFSKVLFLFSKHFGKNHFAEKPTILSLFGIGAEKELIAAEALSSKDSNCFVRVLMTFSLKTVFLESITLLRLDFHFEPKTSSVFSKTLSAEKPNCVFCVHKTPWGKFDLLKNVELFFHFSGLWAEKKTNFRELFAKVFIIVFLVSKLCFEENRFCWKKYKFVHLFGLRAEESFHLSRRLRGRSFQRALTVSWVTLEEKQFFRRTHQIFDRFRTLGKKLGVSLIFTRRVVVKTAFFESRKNFEENFFAEKTTFWLISVEFSPEKKWL